MVENRTESQDKNYINIGNEFMNRLFGPKLHSYTAGTNMHDAMQLIGSKLIKKGGGVAHVIPSGKPNPIGALGYLKCAIELVSKLKDQSLKIDRLITATVSAGA